MSLKYRIERIDNMTKSWGLNREHDLISSLQLDKNIFKDFKVKIKLYVSRALNFSFEENDDDFLKKINKARENRKNVTPNGAVVPKKEFQLEYNIILRDWSITIKNMIKKDKKLLSIFRITPNIRVKYGKELEDNIGRPLNTAVPHSDAWLEGPWGLNCYFPILGDCENNTLVYYQPKKGEFDEKMMSSSTSYENMNWVMKHYEKIDFVPKKGNIYFSDYAMVHNTFRSKNCDTRLSMDTTLYLGKHKPNPDRESEYREGIPDFGITTLIDPGQYENEKFAEKKSANSHYTSKVLKTINIE